MTVLLPGGRPTPAIDRCLSEGLQQIPEYLSNLLEFDYSSHSTSLQKPTICCTTRYLGQNPPQEQSGTNCLLCILCCACTYFDPREVAGKVLAQAPDAVVAPMAALGP